MDYTVVIKGLMMKAKIIVDKSEWEKMGISKETIELCWKFVGIRVRMIKLGD